MLRIYILAFLVLVFTSCNDNEGSTENIDKTGMLKTSILRVTPSAGEDIPISNEIVFQFSDDVVPLGKMDRLSSDINIDISPVLDCEWRWISRSALACKLSEKDKLKPATTYKIIVNEHVSKEDEFYINNTYKHLFTTILPTISYQGMETWVKPDLPYIKLYFNMPVTKESVENKIHFAKTNQSIPIHTIDAIEIKNAETTVIKYIRSMSSTITAKQEWIIAPNEGLGLNESVGIIAKSGLTTPLGPLKGKFQNIETVHTFPEFKYLGFTCSRNKKTDKCNPQSRVGYVFSSPVLPLEFKEKLNLTPLLNAGKKDFDPWSNQYNYSELSYEHRKDQKYTVWLPGRLKAFRYYVTNIRAMSLKDEFDRALKEEVYKTFSMDHRDPRLRLNHRNVVLEKNIDSDIPLYATNIDDITFQYSKMQAYNVYGKTTVQIPTQDIEDLEYKNKMGIRKILDGNSGIIYGKVITKSIQKDYPRPLFAQVTPFQVHAKLGHFNSLIWLTDFAHAKPIVNAKITLMSGYLHDIIGLKTLPYTGITNDNGLVHFPGTEEIDKQLKDLGWLSQSDKRFFIKVEKDNDIALLPLDNNFKIRSYGTYSSMHKYGDHAKAWGTTAQGVYKLGDNVQYKIYVRDQNNTNLISPDKYNLSLQVTDPLGKLVYDNKSLTLNDYGSFSADFRIPKQGAVGKYIFSLKQVRKVGDVSLNYSWKTMSILVSDFTPAAFSVKTDLNGDSFEIGDKVKVTSIASMYSGGPYGNTEARVTGHIFEKTFRSEHTLAKGFRFGSNDGRKVELFNLKEKLNSKGELSTEYTLKDVGVDYGELFVETSVKDERGKYIASNIKSQYSQVDRFVGLKNSKWIYSKDEESFLKVLVVNEAGIPKKGTLVKVDIQYKEYKSSRVKGAGNAFVTVNSSKWVSESSCSINSTLDTSKCVFTPQNIGSYKFIATIKDTKGRKHTSTINAWVSGQGSIVWDQSNDSTLQIIPENNIYKIGQTAKYLIKNPFPGAKALVTVERYGVLDSWVQTLETGTPVIEVPIKAEYLPGFYLSVTVVSPRIEKPLGEGIVDLGKPSYRMGYTRTIVKDKYKELNVKIETNKKVYAPQGSVEISLHVEKKIQEKEDTYELAVIVIDESVYALNKKGKAYYNPYLGFNSLDSLDVTNFSMISRLIGRQKFEKKGANQGGDGGKTTSLTTLRDDFKYIAYWNPHILTDKNGDATVNFKVPDNLTGWKVIVLAVGKNDTMGIGTNTFKTNKSTEVRPVMPNQVLEGDTFSAGFNIMNRTDKIRDFKVTIDVSGLDEKIRSKVFNFKLAAFERKNVYIPITTKSDGVLTFKITAGDKNDSDSTIHKLTVNKRSSLETMANFGSFVDGNISESIQVPIGIIPNVGSVGVVLSTSVISNVDGAFKYIKDYPYWCWEQRLTKAIAAAHYQKLNKYISKDFNWKGSKKLTQTMLNDSTSFQASNGGMAFWKGSNEYVSPYLSAYTALEFSWLKQNGYLVPSNVEKKLVDYLNNMLRKEAFPSNYSVGMSATVRSVALNALSKSGDITKDDVSRYYRHYKSMSLFGKANYLEALINVHGIDKEIKKEVLGSILSASTQSAGKFQFNEVYDNGSAYLLATPMRTNCAILSTIVAAEQDTDLHKQVKGIAPKLVRTITQTRGKKDHWENTQENSFCMKALVDYAQVYETEPIDMNVKVRYDNEEIGEVEFSSKTDKSSEIFTELEKNDIGKKTSLDISKVGSGRLYYTSRISYAPKEENANRVNSGIEIRREYSVERNGKFEILQSPMTLKQGEIVRIDLFVSLPTARNYVVLNDPIPGGLEPINSELATTSVIDASKGKFQVVKDSWWFHFSDWSSYGRYNWSFYHKELRHDSARFYSDYLPAGNYHLLYTAQAIAQGDYTVMPTHAEEMYDPDIYGKSLPAKLHISNE